MVFEINLFGNKKDLISVEEFICDWNNSSNYIETQTSGTTGSGQFIRIKKEQMINSAKATGKYFNFKEGCDVLLCLNPQFIAGKMMIVRALVFKMNLWVVAPSLHPLDGLEQHFYFAAMVPAQIEKDITTIDHVLLGGGAINATLDEKLQNFTAAYYHSFAMTETTSHIALRAVNGAKKNSLFTCLEGVSVSVDDRSCLVIDAPQLAEERIITNDVVTCISNTQFKWLGRYDHIINTGGVKINPEELEQIIAPCLKQRCYISGVPDEKWGQRVVLVVEGKAWSVQEQEQFLIKIKPLLKRFVAPKEIHFVPFFEETSTLKIRRKNPST